MYLYPDNAATGFERFFQSFRLEPWHQKKTSRSATLSIKGSPSEGACATSAKNDIPRSACRSQRQADRKEQRRFRRCFGLVRANVRADCESDGRRASSRLRCKGKNVRVLRHLRRAARSEPRPLAVKPRAL